MSHPLMFGPPVISVDVEDWPQSTWDRNLPITERAAVNTRRILEVLHEAGVHATLFVLGKFAKTFPRIVRDLHAAGHEIACHGYGHVEIFKQSPGQFARDVFEAKDLLEQITGERIKGYRAPDFSVVRPTLWALEILAEAGFAYDSSIFPVRRARYGIPDWPVAPTRVRLAGRKSIIEAPIATFRCFGKNWPVGGGGYHRLLPGFISRYFAKSVMSSNFFVFYCHPYEFDAAEFKDIPLRLPLYVRLHQGLGRRWFRRRFLALLRQFGGQRMDDLLLTRTWPDFALDSFVGSTRLSADQFSEKTAAGY